jgi:hypothetical protein
MQWIHQTSMLPLEVQNLYDIRFLNYKPGHTTSKWATNYSLDRCSPIWSSRRVVPGLQPPLHPPLHYSPTTSECSILMDGHIREEPGRISQLSIVRISVRHVRRIRLLDCLIFQLGVTQRRALGGAEIV